MAVVFTPALGHARSRYVTHPVSYFHELESNKTTDEGVLPC